MDDIPTRANPAVDFETEAERHTAAAERQLADSAEYDASDAAPTLAAAQVSATLALGAEIRAHSLRTEDALITMLDHDRDTEGIPALARIMTPPPLPPGPDPALAAVIGLVLFMVAAVATAGIIIGLGQGEWSVPFLAGAAAALFMVERRLPR